jgi:hypothetical protein
VNMAMNVQVKKCWEILQQLRNYGFVKETQLHGIIYLNIFMHKNVAVLITRGLI